MPDSAQTSRPDRAQPPSTPRLSRYQQLNKLYALPVPLRTFPLPPLVPHNPLSLFHILYVWLSQTVSPPSSHFEPLYEGFWSPDTRSVHVKDNRSTRGLWEQGFFGKGSLSRSEPSWMKGQLARANDSRATSEEATRRRREERQQTKWERARKEREAIEQKLLEEAEAVLEKEATVAGTLAPVKVEALARSHARLPNPKSKENAWSRRSLEHLPSPVEPGNLLSLPNSVSDIEHWTYNNVPPNRTEISERYPSPVSPLDILVLSNPIEDLFEAETSPAEPQRFEETKHHHHTNGHLLGSAISVNGIAESSADDSLVQSDDTLHTSSLTPNASVLTTKTSETDTSPDRPRLKTQKSVRFSPSVEQSTFVQSEPPSPGQGSPSISASTSIEITDEKDIIEDQEHFQLMMEEAFFLSYSLGVLDILDPASNSSISNRDLFTLFRKSSHFPPVSNPILSPDDNFLLNYVVYHHYRSLGWCVRGGAKFSCDFMLYNRGPVFTHAEYAILIIPAYTDPYWGSNAFLQNYVKGKQERSWSWMHCINRVISQVKKKLVLVYVDVPRPLDTDTELRMGIDEVLGRYKVREFVMRRWLSNRDRDVK